MLSDGIGLVMLLAYLNDELKQSTLVKSSYGIDFFKKFLAPFVMFPICFMRMGKLTGEIHEDPNQKLMKLTPCAQSSMKELIISKGYQVSTIKADLKKNYPEYKINDYLTAHLSSAFAEYLPKVGDSKVKVMRGFLAVNIRDPDEFSSHPESVVFANINAPAPFQFIVDSDIKKAMKTHKDQFNAFLDRHMIRMNVLTERCFTAFGDWVIDKIYNALAQFEFAITNVAGPSTEMKFNGKKILKIIPFANTVGISGLTVLYFSYLDELKVYFCKDSNLPLDCDALMKVFEQKLDESLNKK